MKFKSLILLVVSTFFMFACDSATKFNNPLDEHNKPSDQTDTEAETDNDSDKIDTMSDNNDENQNRDDADSANTTPDNSNAASDNDAETDSGDSTPDNDADSSDTSSPDNDTTPANPCNPNPCSSVANSNGNCTASGSTNYSCGCKTHYSWNSSSKTCVADTQTVDCTGLPATGALWNTVSSITQTWNGSDWEPSNVATHNDEASTQECRYKCQEHYTWTNSTCKADQQVKNCTEIPANAEWNTVSTITQTWNGSAWAPSTNTTYNEIGSTEECRFKCAENYTYENSQCVGAKRSKPCTGLPKNAVWNTAESIEQTWDGYDWTPSNTGVYNTTASADYCRYKCDEYCEWKDSKCVSPCDSEPCVSVENSTGHCSITAWDEYSCECESGYYWNGSKCKPTPSAGRICTGQNKCYNNSEEITCPAKDEEFFGQDSQYAERGTCLPQKFRVDTISGYKVVVDLNLGLMWQQTINHIKYTWDKAKQYCNFLGYAGYSDWRMPTIHELLTIVDHSRYNPAIDTTYFPDTPSDKFWSSNKYSGDYYWYMNFTYGSTNNALSYSGDSNSEYYYVRCVRSDQ